MKMLHAAGQEGLSPLARGNQTGSGDALGASGPIPARTGQPAPSPPKRAQVWAYPRSHGATLLDNQGVRNRRGLSPLARGNPDVLALPGVAAGPIPARTGQPYLGVGSCCTLRAYPRSHGATRIATPVAHCCEGLSPLARGNLGHRHPAVGRVWPIPARTGQPAAAGCSCRSGRAYPRSHGATLLEKLLMD